MKHPLLRNYPGNIDDIEWQYLDKETYIEIEDILTKDVVLFDPFLVDNFYPEEMFDELVEICNSYDLKKIDFSNQMNKWEEGIEIPQKFIDYAVNKVRELLDTEDVIFGYHMYAHHQITNDNRIPKLPLHIDWAQGPYMVDLQIGGNRDWGFVARDKNFVCKPNQAVICQPQLDFHYRPAWGNDDPNEYYQAIFFHLINKNSWSIPNDDSRQDRDEHLNNKYNFGKDFRESEEFKAFQFQRRKIFDEIYVKEINDLSNRNLLPPIPWDALPSETDANIHDRKGVEPKGN